MKKLLCLLLLIFFGIFSNSQIILNTNQFQLISYDLTQSDKIDIYSYLSIDKNGNAKIYIHNHKGIKYYVDKLTEKEINEINSLISTNKLDNYLKIKELPKNMHYAGNRNFISFINTTNTIEKLCFINPFMSEDFNNAYMKIISIISRQNETNEVPNFIIDFEKLNNEVLTQNKVDNYLPKKELPPPSL